MVTDYLFIHTLQYLIKHVLTLRQLQTHSTSSRMPICLPTSLAKHLRREATWTAVIDIWRIRLFLFQLYVHATDASAIA